MVSFDLKEAAAFLKVHPETMRQMAKDGTVSGAKIGRRWVFLKEHLVSHITNNYATNGGLRLVVDNTNGSKKWQFTNGKMTGASVGTLTSSRRVASEYDNLLARQTSNKRKSCTTK